MKLQLWGRFFNSGGTRKSNNEWKGVVEFGPQTWSIDLVLVIIERGNLILGVPPPSQWAESYKNKIFCLRIWICWAQIDPWYLIRKVNNKKSFWVTSTDRKSLLNTPGLNIKFLGLFSKNKVFWPKCFCGSFREQHLWL